MDFTPIFGLKLKNWLFLGAACLTLFQWNRYCKIIMKYVIQENTTAFNSMCYLPFLCNYLKKFTCRFWEKIVNPTPFFQHTCKDIMWTQHYKLKHLQQCTLFHIRCLVGGIHCAISKYSIEKILLLSHKPSSEKNYLIALFRTAIFSQD